MRMTKSEILDIIEKASQLLADNDLLDASEKLYKAAEESIKVLAIKENSNLDSSDYWTTRTLWDQVRTLAGIYGDEVRNSWDAAWRVSTNTCFLRLKSKNVFRRFWI
ncbi:Archaeal PaREP1/PaREP8 family protein [Thermoplasmatales archaeon]|nr:Archaeal PaREP1/PaREP8 family protein [Thermoplasmatales archaeon]